MNIVMRNDHEGISSKNQKLIQSILKEKAIAPITTPIKRVNA
jgi:hypothetical protein|tara:strand:- start:295 stop:420 length:126 start_codon:yes stop_codon:yes gene_type:complete